MPLQELARQAVVETSDDQTEARASSMNLQELLARERAMRMQIAELPAADLEPHDAFVSVHEVPLVEQIVPEATMDFSVTDVAPVIIEELRVPQEGVQTDELEAVAEHPLYPVREVISSTIETVSQLDAELVEVVKAEPLQLETLQAELPFLDISLHVLEDSPVKTLEKTSHVPVLEQLMTHTENLDIPQRAEAQAIITILTSKIEQSLVGVDDPFEQEALEQELEAICERLLIVMGVIDPSEELVKQFVLLLKKDVIAQLELAEEVFVDGMHERKNFADSVWQDINDALHPALPLLGRYAVRLAV